MSHGIITTKKVGTDPLPAINISSKKFLDDPMLARLYSEFSAFLKAMNESAEAQAITNSLLLDNVKLRLINLLENAFV